MAEEMGVTLENVFDSETVWRIMNNDKRLRSLQFLDSKWRMRDKYKQILRTLARNSTTEYGPRMTSKELTKLIVPTKNIDYETHHIDTYCMALQRGDVLKRAGKAEDGSSIWVYVIPQEMLPKECRDVYSTLEGESLNLEEIAEKVDMEEDQLIRSLDILEVQCYV